MEWLLGVALGLLILAFIVVPIVFYRLKLVDKAQALGLPEGSVRALIAMVLISLFCVAPIYLFGSLSGAQHVMHRVPAEQIAKMQNDSKYLGLETEPEGAPAKDGAINYKATYETAPDVAEVDFAKQMLILLGTLATSVTGFYFGAQIATSASTKGAALAGGAQVGPTTQPPPPDPTDLRKTANAVGAISTGVKAQIAGLGADPLGALRTAVAAASGNKDSATFLTATESAMKTMTTKANGCAADADRADQAATNAAVAGIDPTALQGLSDSIDQYMTDATQSNHDFGHAMADFKTASDGILKMTAQG